MNTNTLYDIYTINKNASKCYIIKAWNQLYK